MKTKAPRNRTLSTIQCFRIKCFELAHGIGWFFPTDLIESRPLQGTTYDHCWKWIFYSFDKHFAQFIFHPEFAIQRNGMKWNEMPFYRLTPNCLGSITFAALFDVYDMIRRSVYFLLLKLYTLTIRIASVSITFFAWHFLIFQALHYEYFRYQLDRFANEKISSNIPKVVHNVRIRATQWQWVNGQIQNCAYKMSLLLLHSVSCGRQIVCAA